jgi:hypothetical protein
VLTRNDALSFDVAEHFSIYSYTHSLFVCRLSNGCVTYNFADCVWQLHEMVPHKMSGQELVSNKMVDKETFYLKRSENVYVVQEQSFHINLFWFTTARIYVITFKTVFK